ncbi:MAG: aldo/keto reductase, partial [Thermoguttaceae bacterium]|nr:aldo/keto reductase [Thermoguttaceae bacterium]
AALRKLMEEGKTRAIGVSNVSLAQLEEFASVCPLAAFQPPYNMLQREIEHDALPWCMAHHVAVLVYWPLMKGLLAGKLRGDETFAGDSRRKYPMFQGDEYRKNLALVERLREIAAISGHTVAELVVNWTIHRPGITAALCGAKRPDQIRETARAASWRLSSEQLALIDEALAQRGPPVTKVPV